LDKKAERWDWEPKPKIAKVATGMRRDETLFVPGRSKSEDRSRWPENERTR